MDEECSRPTLEHNQGPEPARLPLASASDPLLDHAASERRRNQSSLGVADRIAQRGIGEIGLPGEPHERPVLEDAHPESLRPPCRIKYNTGCYRCQRATDARAREWYQSPKWCVLKDGSKRGKTGPLRTVPSSGSKTEDKQTMTR